jgi:sterol desaturase/sphingolipid hydroxylase (fatty acid hydroxylase superfamily)
VVQLVAVLFLSDFIQYWSHLIMHYWKPLWHVHAVHHSPEQIDWLVAARVHPFELGINKALAAAPLYWIGFSPEVFAVSVPLAATYSLLIHSNLSWTYGPFGYIITSPAFHRWHHSSDPLARDTNFAQTFSCIDFLLGTAYFPRGQKPEKYGLVSDVMPRGIIGQFLYPIRRWLQTVRGDGPGDDATVVDPAADELELAERRT